MTTHGGVRRNAGRPKLRASERKLLVNFTLAPEVVREFKRKIPPGHRARFVEQAILLKLSFDQAEQGKLDPKLIFDQFSQKTIVSPSL